MENRHAQLTQEARELAEHLFPEDEFENIFSKTINNYSLILPSLWIIHTYSSFTGRESNLNMVSMKRKLIASARQTAGPGTKIPVEFVNQVAEKATELAINPFNQRVDDYSQTLEW